MRCESARRGGSAVARATLFALLLVAVGSLPLTGQAADEAAPDQVVSFKRDVLPRLMAECGICHQSADPHGLLVIDEENAYNQLVDVPSYELPSMKRVSPGDPQQSYLWLKVNYQYLAAGGKGWGMPILAGGIRDPEFKKAIHDWIEQGAKNN